MTKLRWVNLICAFLATLTPLAHVLELANKLALAAGAAVLLFHAFGTY
jgi:hypothetical protein